MPAGIAGVRLSFLAAYFLGCADRFAEAETFFDGFVDASRQAGSASGFASASAWRSFVASCRGDLSAAEAHARAGLDTTRSIGLQLVELTLCPSSAGCRPTEESPATCGTGCAMIGPQLSGGRGSRSLGGEFLCDVLAV